MIVCFGGRCGRVLWRKEWTCVGDWGLDLCWGVRVGVRWGVRVDLCCGGKGRRVFGSEGWTCVGKGGVDVCWEGRSGRVLGREEWTCVGKGGVDVCWEGRSGRVLGMEEWTCVGDGGVDVCWGWREGWTCVSGVRLRLKERNRIVVLVGSKQLEEWSIRVKWWVLPV